MGQDGGQEPEPSNRERHVSRWAARAHQQREDEVCQSCGAQLQYRNVWIVKIIYKRPRAVYELEDSNGTLIDGQFYREELTRVRITRRANYDIDKLLDKRFRRGIRLISRTIARIQSGH